MMKTIIDCCSELRNLAVFWFSFCLFIFNSADMTFLYDKMI